MNRGRFLVNLALNNAVNKKESVDKGIKTNEKSLPCKENTDNGLQVHKTLSLPIFTEDNHEIGYMSYVSKDGKHFN